MTHIFNDEMIEEYATHFYTRDGWRDWTPTVTQLGNVTVTVDRAKYVVIGNTVHIMAELRVTGAGTAGNAIEIGGIPTAVQPSGLIALGVSTIGTCSVLDQGVAVYYGFTVVQTASTFRLRDSNTRGEIGSNPNFALANTDVITLRGSYER